MGVVTLFGGLLGLASVSQAQGVYAATPSDDVWVYGNAGDPAGDPIFRIWGMGNSSINPTYPPGDYSYAYLKWNLAAVPQLAAGQYYRITEATLTVTSQRASNYTLATAQQNPLEARPLATNFSEATWNYDDANPNPDDSTFGMGDTANYSASVVYRIPINLLAATGAFQTQFNAQFAANGQVGIALTSSIPAIQMGGAFYRIYSKDDPGGRRPTLRVAYEPVTSISGNITLENAVSNAQPITFTFTPTATGTAFSRMITPSSTGAFTLADIPLRGYTVGIKGAKWLRAVKTTDASQVPQPTITATLKGGDANNDNAVDIADLLLLINAYNRAQPDPLYSAAADFTGDGFNDIADLLTLIQNYNVEGA